MGRKLCPGRPADPDDGTPAQPCVFAGDGSGGAAQASRGHPTCLFCDRKRVYAMCSDKDFTNVMKYLHKFKPEIQEKAIEYIDPDQIAYVRQQLQRRNRCVGFKNHKFFFLLVLTLLEFGNYVGNLSKGFLSFL